MNYIGIDQEGRFVCAASLRIPTEDLAQKIASWIREGLRIEHCDDDFVRHNFGEIIQEVNEDEK